MNRKKIYGLLAFVVLVPIVCFAVLVPSATKAMFFHEFKHNAGLMFGYEPEPVTGADGTSGLRIEHPEEYGMAPSEDSGDGESTESQSTGGESVESE